jgi:mono/diheme cytochrome c family protein
MRRWIAALLLVAGSVAASVATGADLERGRAIYDGRVALSTVESGRGGGCVACHRPSGMGNFEGGIAVPPIAGPMLFRALDRDTGRYFAASARWRVRPAYDDASLAHLLRTGTAPDGKVLAATMPRYRMSDADAADLAAYLRELSARPPAGLDDESVHLATVTTPDVDPQRRDALVSTLERFVQQKNGQSRHESHRSVQAARTREMVMYRKFRVWKIEHWVLEGDASTWARQLESRQAAAPVYALVSGLGGAQWGPVDAFCERQRLPCLLPLVDAGGGAAPGFYSLHYHAGVDSDAALAARALADAGLRHVELWSDQPLLADRVRGVLVRHGLTVSGAGRGAAGTARAVVSLLAPSAHAGRVQGERRPVAWLAGTHGLGPRELAPVLAGTASGWIVTPMRQGDDLDRQLLRTRLWMRSVGLQTDSVEVVASALHAATVLGEGLTHVDFAFTPEYVLELLEHGLENMVPWSPFSRLAIGPDQRIASKGSWVGVVRDGAARWRWETSPQP